MTNKFKVGDKVRIIKSGWSTSMLDVGRETTVLAVEGDTRILYDARHLAINGDKVSGHVNGFELVKPRGLQVGDSVLIKTSGECSRHYLKIGTVAVVETVAEEDDEWPTAVLSGENSESRVVQQVVEYTAFERIDPKPLDFTKPMETYEGTPVKLLATGGVDAKFPVLVLEGKATLPTKYTLSGVAKNGVARRFIRNVEPKPVVKVAKKPSTYYVNIYPDNEIGEGRFESRKAADVAYEGAKKQMGDFCGTRIGVAKIQPGFYAE